MVQNPTAWQEKIHGFLAPADDKPEHFAAIGRLVTAMNGIDAVLNWILRAQIGADTKIGRTIVGGMRTNDMLAAIKRVARVSGMSGPEYAALEELHRQIGVFKDVRDNTAHKIWAVRGREMSFSNAHVSRFQDSAEFAVYTIEELNELARYAPYLSERALDFFPKTVARGGRLPSREIPLRLRPTDQSRGKGRRDAQSPKRQHRASPA
jgi:hypothetical protein